MMHVRTATGTKDIAAIHVRTAAGLKEIDNASIRTASGVKDFFSPGGGGGAFQVNVSNYGPRGSVANPNSVTVTTSIVTLTPSGGQAPYTYAWSKLSGLEAWDIIVVSPGQARFACSQVAPFEEIFAEFACVVTDARGRQVSTGSITASVYNFGGNV